MIETPADYRSFIFLIINQKIIIDDLPAGRQVETPADYRSFIFLI
jgi:hypothetical protein